MKRTGRPAMLAALLLAVLIFAPALAQDLGRIAPGLTGTSLCPLVKSNPQIAINAIASGAAHAYDQGSQAQSSYAQVMAAAVMAANANGCLNELFEGLNQAMIKGGSKVEYITGKTIAIGTAQGTASDAGQVLAKATAVVICRGGASAQACARAWNQAVKIDPKNGCTVLVKAYVQARAYCKGNKAVTDVKSGVYKTALGSCDTSSLYDSNGGYNSGGDYNSGNKGYWNDDHKGIYNSGNGGGYNSGNSGGYNSGNNGGYNSNTDGGYNFGNNGGYSGGSGSAWNPTTFSTGGQSGTFGNGMGVSQGPGGQQVSFPGGESVFQGAGGQQFGFGRKMLADQEASLAGSAVIRSPGFHPRYRRLLGTTNWQSGRAIGSAVTSAGSGITDEPVVPNSAAADSNEGNQAHCELCSNISKALARL